MHVIYNYTRETNHVCRIYSAVLQLFRSYNLRNSSSYFLIIIIIIIIIITIIIISFMQGINTYIFLRSTMSPGNTVLQLFCCYYPWCIDRYLQCCIYCTFTLVLIIIIIVVVVIIVVSVSFEHVINRCNFSSGLLS
jgi:hypothetical protein